MTRAIEALLLAAMLIIQAAAARGNGPEQLEQLEPERGEWQAELHSHFSGSKSEGGQHSLELFRGLSEHVALGVEVEGGWERWVEKGFRNGPRKHLASTEDGAALTCRFRGTGVVLATRGKEVALAAGTPLTVKLTAPLTLRVRAR